MKSLPSVMGHSFSQVPKAEIPRSSFDRNSGLKTTFDSGYLIPIFCDEALPGDTYNLSSSIFARLATPLHPFMDNVMLHTFFFAVPLRLVWDNTQKFFGEQRNPGDSTDFIIPQMTAPAVTGYAPTSIYDYFELPVGIPSISHSALPLRAYNLIWNEWFRDENLQDSVVNHTGDGPDLTTDYRLLRRGKRHDYFTSSLPWPQKGDSVDLPLGTSAPIKGIGIITPFTFAPPPGGTVYHETGPANVTYAGAANPTSGLWGFQQDPVNTQHPLIYADLAQATGATINQLRQAFALQKLRERDARGGTRYTEILRAHFNVVSPDARLQRPEYLGGGSTPINLYQVPQNSGTGAYTATPQGSLAAYGTASASGHGFTKSFTEHTIIIGLVSVRADLNYQQGMARMWSRKSKYDFYWPALAHIGEQAVLMKEIYATGVPAEDDSVWGYQERFGEMRYRNSMVTAEMRSSFPQSLDTWHLAQDFATAPALNAAFIEDNPPIDRVIAVQDEPQFIMDCFHKLRCARPMPTYGVPGQIDRF